MNSFGAIAVTEKTRNELAVTMLRDAIISGHFKPGQNLKDSEVAQYCGVSRTPARFALAALHRESLLSYREQRGYRVRAFDSDSVLSAYQIRGAVEALACRRIIEGGLVTDRFLDTLADCVETGRQILAAAGRSGSVDADAWRKMNERFHHTIVAHAGEMLFEEVCAFAERVPLCAASVTADFSAAPSAELLRYAQYDHENILSAIRARQSARVAALVEEHLYRAGALIAAKLAKARPTAATDNVDREGAHR